MSRRLAGECLTCGGDTKFGAIEVIFPKPPVGGISTIQDLLLRQVNRARLEILPGALQEFNLNFSKVESSLVV